MSAFTVDVDHVDYLVTAALRFGMDRKLTWWIETGEIKHGAPTIENTTECTWENTTEIGRASCRERVSYHV